MEILPVNNAENPCSPGVPFCRRDRLLAQGGLNAKKQSFRIAFLCAHLGSNQGPKDYESSTLTN